MVISVYADAACCWAGSSNVGPAMLRKWMCVDIFLETPLENAPICSWMYMRNVSEDQRPNFLMVSRSMPLSFIAMAPPARSEWELTDARS